ncbi:unnamed protein product [Rhizoctonia solani]|uniref:Proteophosphoglycan ppg4 n=1 Tax=Rhizoctonia solani TaxID=456999 RepID=A0A8H3HJP0_9AGAM|nr:unnamed protein product [Rhizoctonia solani]
MQADNRLLTNLIKCEKEHHSALLALLVRSHTSLAALSAYASTASPPVAQALRGCIQSFAAADEGLRGYAAAIEGWKEELKEVKRVEDELKAVVKDKDILVGRLIKASKQKIPTSSIQAGPAPIPTASSPSSSSLSFSMPTSQPYQYTPTPHATQHINSKLAQAQRELQACESHLAGKEAELAEVRRSAIAEGMARRCRAMADVGHVWRERGEMGLGALSGLSGADMAAPPNQYYNPPRRTLSTSTSTSSSLAPSHSVSQHRRSQSPFSPTYSHSRSASPGPGTYHSISGGYQHSHPLPALPERNSWHVEDTPRRPEPRRPVSLVDPPRAPALHRRPISSHELPALPDEVTFDIPPPHSIGHDTNEFIPLGRPVSAMGNSGSGERWEDTSSEEEGNYRVVENDTRPRWEEEVDPEILRAVEQMGKIAPAKPKERPSSDMLRNTPPTPPDTVSSSSPSRLPDLRVIEATPQKGRGKGKGKKARKAKRDDEVTRPSDESVRQSDDLVGRTRDDRLGRADEGAGEDTIVLPPAPTSTRTAAAPSPALKALPEPVLDEPIPRAASPVAPRAVSPSPPPRVASPSPAPRVASPAPAPRIASPAHIARTISPPPADPTPSRLASPILAPTPTVSAPAPQPGHAMIQVARAPVPAHDRRPRSPSPTPFGNGVLGDHDDVMLDKSSLISSTTHHTDSEGSSHHAGDEASNHTQDQVPASPNEVFETPPSTAGFASCQVKSHTTELATSGLSETPKAASSVLGTPKAPSSVFDTPRAPSTTFGTPRAPSIGFGTPKAPSTVFETPRALPSAFSTPKPVVYSPSALLSPLAAPESVYETPQVIPSDIPRVPRYEEPEVPRSPRMEVPKSPRLDIPNSPRLDTSTSPVVHAKSPQSETTLSPTGLVTPMATGSNPKSHMTASASEPAIQDRPRTKSTSKRRVVSGDEAGKKKTIKKKGHSRQSSAVEPSRRQPNADQRADLAERLRDSDTTAPHVHFPSSGMFVPSAPPPRPQPGALYLPSNGTTRSDVGPARGHHFEVPPSPATSSGRARSGSVNGSTSFFGRVAGFFGKKKPSDGYLSAGGGQAWRTRIDSNVARNRDDSSEDEPQPKNLVTVTNVNTRLDKNQSPGSPKRGGLGRKLTKADKGQTLRVGPPESPTQTRKPSIAEEQIVPARNRKSKSRSVDGGGVSRKGSLKSNASDPHGRASSDVGRKLGKEPPSLMAIVEGPGLVLPSEFVSRRTDSPGPRSESPAPSRSRALAVPAAPKSARETSPMPLKSALRNRTPSPLPPMNDTPAQPALAVSAPNASGPSPRNSIAESIYETGEEDFDAATDGEDDRSDITAAGPSQSASIPVPVPAQPVHSPGAALVAFKDNLQASTTGAGSLSTAGPRSANSTQRKSVRINPAPPQMSATPSATPGSELEEEPLWTRKDDKPSSSGGWSSRIGRGWEDSSDESIDEEYERIRNALATSSKHMEAVNKPTHSRR